MENCEVVVIVLQGGRLLLGSITGKKVMGKIFRTCRIFGACCWKSLDSIDLKVLCVELIAKMLRKRLGMDWA